MKYDDWRELLFMRAYSVFMTLNTLTLIEWISCLRLPPRPLTPNIKYYEALIIADLSWTRYGHSKRVKLRISDWTLVINFLAFTEIVRIPLTGGRGGGVDGRGTPGPSSLHPCLNNVTFKRSVLSYDCLFLTSETLWRMGTSFRYSDFWDCLSGQALVMIGHWYSPVISTCNNYPPEWTQKWLR